MYACLSIINLTKMNMNNFKENSYRINLIYFDNGKLIEIINDKMMST